MATLTESRLAGIAARPGLQRLLADARAYPASYDRERLMMEADRILDESLDEARRILSRKTKRIVMCAVCQDEGCEMCPKVSAA